MPAKIIPINKNTTIKGMLENAMEVADEYNKAVLILINKVNDLNREYELMWVNTDIPELFMTVEVLKNYLLNNPDEE